MKITEQIPVGKENAISSKELETLTGLTKRQIKKAVRDARINNVLICSGQTGYYTPADMNELMNWYIPANKRVKDSFMPLKHARAILKAAGINLDKGSANGKEKNK